jgi:hypothetical protein
MKNIGIVALVILVIVWLKNRQAAVEPEITPATKFVWGDHVKMRTDLGYQYPDLETYKIIGVYPNDPVPGNANIIGYYVFMRPGSKGFYSIVDADRMFEKVIA